MGASNFGSSPYKQHRTLSRAAKKVPNLGKEEEERSPPFVLPWDLEKYPPKGDRPDMHLFPFLLPSSYPFPSFLFCIGYRTFSNSSLFPLSRKQSKKRRHLGRHLAFGFKKSLKNMYINHGMYVCT